MGFTDDVFGRVVDVIGRVATTVLEPWGEPQRAWTRTKRRSVRLRTPN